MATEDVTQHRSDAEPGAPEVLHAVRRVDGEQIGDYSFMCTSGPDDWAHLDEDLEDRAVEYEMVRMTVERVATKTFGSPVCDRWRGEYSPAREWFEVVIESQSDDTWPARDSRLATNESEADAQIRVAMLPDVFIVADGIGAHEVRRDQLRIDRKQLQPLPGRCVTCGNDFFSHAAARS